MHKKTYIFLKKEIEKVKEKYDFLSISKEGRVSKSKLINQINFILNSLDKLNSTKKLENERTFNINQILGLFLSEIEYLNNDLLETPYYANWQTISTKINWLIVDSHNICLDFKKDKKILNDDILKDEKEILIFLRNAISHETAYFKKMNIVNFQNIFLKICGIAEKETKNFLNEEWIQNIFKNDIKFGSFKNINLKVDTGKIRWLETNALTLDFIGKRKNNNLLKLNFETLSIFNLLILINDILIDFCKNNYPEFFSNE